MKITNEQLRAIQERDSVRSKQDKAVGGFDELLARQLEQKTPLGAGGVTTLPSATGLTAPASLTGILEDAAPTAPAFSQEGTERMEGMFATLENYAAALNGNADLRGAYGLLQELSGQVAGFKERFPNAGTEQPALAAMLNEVDVLATTETYKFNRGDYL